MCRIFISPCKSSEAPLASRRTPLARLGAMTWAFHGGVAACGVLEQWAVIVVTLCLLETLWRVNHLHNTIAKFSVDSMRRHSLSVPSSMIKLGSSGLSSSDFWMLSANVKTSGNHRTKYSFRVLHYQASASCSFFTLRKIMNDSGLILTTLTLSSNVVWRIQLMTVSRMHPPLGVLQQRCVL